MTTTQVSCTRPQTSGRPRAWHYILLGLLWGSAWLYMALIGYRHVAPDSVAGAAQPSVVV